METFSDNRKKKRSQGDDHEANTTTKKDLVSKVKEGNTVTLCFKSRKLIGKILEYCSVHTLCLVRLVSKLFNSAAEGPLFRRCFIKYKYYNSSDCSFKWKTHRVTHNTEEFIELHPPLTHLELCYLPNRLPLPHSIMSLSVIERLNIKVADLPSTLKVLSIGDIYFNQPVDNIPVSLTRLSLPNQFDQKVDHLPPSLRFLRFGHSFNQPIDNLPLSLTHLEFWSSGMFNQPIDKLPPKLRHLALGDKFNHPIDHLPNHLKFLKLGDNFNQPISQLPASIRYLGFGNEFNQFIDCYPPQLQSLHFGDSFDQWIGNLPSSIKILKLGLKYTQLILKLPSSLKTFYPPPCYPLKFLPSMITHLLITFNQTVDQFPNSITHLTFGKSFNQPVNHLPNSITHLTFGADFNQKVNHLPGSITHLTLGWYFNRSVSKLPNSITHLAIGGNFNRKVDALPQSITHLNFGLCHYNQNINTLPSSITHIVLTTYSLHLLEKLPSSVTHLAILHGTPSNVRSIPRSVNVLVLGEPTQRCFPEIDYSELDTMTTVVRYHKDSSMKKILHDFDFFVGKTLEQILEEEFSGILWIELAQLETSD